MNCERKNITEPADWWDAFQQQATRDGQTLSEWLGDCGRANLDEDLQCGLSERPPAHRPRIAAAGSQRPRIAAAGGRRPRVAPTAQDK